MTPRAIIQKAQSIGLDMIAICDHNSCENVRAVQQAAKDTPLTVLAGIEVTSSEEVHTLGLFDTDEESMKLQEVVYSHLFGENDPEIFGYQVLMDKEDEVVALNDRLLIGSTTLPLEEVVDCIHSLGGLAISSHCDREGFGLIANLGFVPEGLPLDALEISPKMNIEKACEALPQVRGFALITSSDAHFLDDIGVVSTTFWLERQVVSEIGKALRNEDGRRVEI
jgi:PHP family Zn ribbon phosphoesterase